MDDFAQKGTELVLAMTRALVNHPEQVSVEVKKGDNTIVFQLKVAPGELGQVLGRQGGNVQAMRKILTAFSTKSKCRAVLEIDEPAAVRPTHLQLAA